MPERVCRDFAHHNRAVVVAPAGCGKTQLIALAIARHGSGRSLVLTHTHAGVRSLRSRLQSYEVSGAKAVVDTIDGFALKYASGYPRVAAMPPLNVAQPDWTGIRQAACRLMDSRIARLVVRQSYSGVFVDEYQDCTQDQHQLILKIADILPCRIVGDPLQGIFGFGNDPLVSWGDDVFANFERLPDLDRPWRWEGANEELGTWLMGIRALIENGQGIDLSNAPEAVSHYPCSDDNVYRVCVRALRVEGSTVAIHGFPAQAHRLARSLGGRYESMETVECRDLLGATTGFEETTGRGLALAVVAFAAECMTGVNSGLGCVLRRIRSGQPIAKKIKRYAAIAQALDDVASSGSPGSIYKALLAMRSSIAGGVFRRELMTDMLKTLRLKMASPEIRLPDLAWTVRDLGRVAGRRIPKRVVSRTLLVKGLEFEHSIVLNADTMDAQNLYVALTRGSRLLTVLSREKTLEPR